MEFIFAIVGLSVFIEEDALPLLVCVIELDLILATCELCGGTMNASGSSGEMGL